MRKITRSISSQVLFKIFSYKIENQGTQKTSLKYFQPLKRESSFSIHKFPKVQVTQLVQSPSHLRCPMPKFPKLSRPKLLKVQVTQSSSHPKLKSPKAQVTQSPSCPDCQKSKFPPCRKNLLLSHGMAKKYLWPSHGQKYLWPSHGQKCLWPSHGQKYLWPSHGQK